MLKVVVFVSAFLMAVLFMMSQLAPIISPNSVSAQIPSVPGFSSSDMGTYQYFNNTQGNFGYNVTSSMLALNIVIPSISFGNGPIQTGGWGNISWPIISQSITVHGYLVQSYFTYAVPKLGNGGSAGSINDAWIFWAHTGIWDSHYSAISYGTIEKNCVAVNGVLRSQVPIDPGIPLTAFFVFPLNSNVDAVLQSHQGYYVVIGQSQAQAIQANGNNAWNYIAGILTFNIPNGGTGNPWFDNMISASIDAAVLFVAFWALTRVIGALMP